jgi:hypothetical protein
MGYSLVVLAVVLMATSFLDQSQAQSVGETIFVRLLFLSMLFCFAFVWNKFEQLFSKSFQARTRLIIAKKKAIFYCCCCWCLFVCLLLLLLLLHFIIIIKDTCLALILV